MKAANAASPDRINGIDSLRFFAAWWVVMCHNFQPPLTEGHDPDSKLAWALNGIYHGSFSGPAAVILFFLISGFCIHWPYATGRPFEWREFYIRRYVRLLLPLLAALAFARLSGVAANDPDPLAGIPAWSLVAETIYYSLYPILRRIAASLGWKKLSACAFVLGLLWAFTKPINNVNYPAWGYAGDWILGLPCWLLGCLLAHTLFREKKTSPTELWLYRVGGIVLGAVTFNLALHLIVGNHLTLNFFGLFAFFWLRTEIGYHRTHAPHAAFEWLGAWSYSLYLTHVMSLALIKKLSIPNLGAGLNWLMTAIWVLAIAFLFHLLCEAPSHRLARFLAKKRTLEVETLAAVS